MNRKDILKINNTLVCDLFYKEMMIKYENSIGFDECF